MPLRLLFMLILLLLPLPVLAQAVHPLQVDIHTTSDRALLQFSGLALRVVRRSVQSEGPGLQGEMQALELKKAAWDTSPASLHADLLVTPTDGPLTLKLERGCPGLTRVTLKSRGKIVFDQTWPLADPKKPQPPQVILPLRADQVLAETPVPRKAFPQKFLAFYYGWYARPEGPAHKWLHWNPAREDHDATHTPQLGWYDSADVQIITQQLDWAQQAGLDGFVLSWWNEPFDKIVVEKLLAETDKRQFEVGLYLESAATPQLLHAQLEQLVQLAARHPSVLKVEGRPVAFLYTRILSQLGPAGLREGMAGLKVFLIGDEMTPQTLDVLDGAHTYLGADVPDKYQGQLLELQGKARLEDKLLVANVVPGFDDTHIRSPGRIEHRLEGLQYRSYWASAKRADWVVLTSWNEWHEGSEIEPSVEFGDKYLQMTKELVDKWRR